MFLLILMLLTHFPNSFYCAIDPNFNSVFCFRLSNNSKTEHSYQHVEKRDTGPSTNKEFPRVNTPAKLMQQKQDYPSTNIDAPINEGMVSPKRKVEHLQHLYIANNVKTSTFNEQSDKNIIINNKNNLKHCQEYSKSNCSHSSMVPERDTDANKTIQSNLVTHGSLKLSAPGTSTSRQHHHITIQELRLQVEYSFINHSSLILQTPLPSSVPPLVLIIHFS